GARSRRQEGGGGEGGRRGRGARPRRSPPRRARRVRTMRARGRRATVARRGARARAPGPPRVGARAPAVVGVLVVDPSSAVRAPLVPPASPVRARPPPC